MKVIRYIIEGLVNNNVYNDYMSPSNFLYSNCRILYPAIPGSSCYHEFWQSFFERISQGIL